MKVLLTGHKGYIGSRLVPMLLEEGFDVVGLDTDLFRDCTFDGELTQVPEIDGDVRDLTERDVEGYDAVVHLAGLSNDPLGDFDPSLTDEINHRASVRLARAARSAGVERFVFASSCSNYGASGDRFLSEEAEFRPVTPYGRSKVDVEHAVSSLATAAFSPVFLRASTAYGLSPRIRFDLVLNNLTAWAFTTGRVYLKSDGAPWRPIVHVDDICRAYVAALKAPIGAVHNQAFNVGLTSENYQILDIAAIVERVVPNCRIELSPDAAPDRRCYRVSCDRIARTLHHFKPEWSARRGVEQLYEAFCRVGLTLDDFEGPRFKRIAHVRKLIGDGALDSRLRWRNGAEWRARRATV
ncbi:MAG: SDR family oxidoreductase [Gammaproteobacteria bacterium]|nr:SDR family oxidoreductase [Gammaproteobacteria bacterium]